MPHTTITDDTLLRELGNKLSMVRIDAGLTQAELARQAGVGRSTVERLEAGHSTQMSSFVRILRVLDLLEQFLGLVPEPSPKPMDLLKLQSRQRKRATGKRKVTERLVKPWKWADKE